MQEHALGSGPGLYKQTPRCCYPIHFSHFFFRRESHNKMPPAVLRMLKQPYLLSLYVLTCNVGYMDMCGVKKRTEIRKTIQQQQPALNWNF